MTPNVAENRRAALNVIRRWPSDEAREWSEQFLSAACSDPKVDAVIAVGSAVRGLGHRGSDVDFIVIVHGTRPRFEREEIDVDVKYFSRDKVDSEIASGHDWLGWAVRFGVPVCDRNHFWERLTKRWRDKLPFPSAAVSRQRARRSAALSREFTEMGDEHAALENLLAMFTHEARARLIDSGIYPASRPELPDQLRMIDEVELASKLDAALHGELSPVEFFGINGTDAIG